MTLRHDDVKAEWGHLCSLALKRGAIADEPLIHDGQDSAPARQPGEETAPALRGDVAARGFWKRGQLAIFDVRVCDTDARSYRASPPATVLERQERDKKALYLAPCQERRQAFTPLVFSVDGLRGAEAVGACRRLAAILAGRWRKPYSEVCGYVRSRLSIALARAASHCLRGSRVPPPSPRFGPVFTGLELGLYR